ncbi:hypothetical protein QBC34DRAFT_432930 [Podospora aff. communis PSN243]|uniref:Uncharacterized protein n=1 Tax=Podospora aff. communis PSN243 TaxID=3040156 RepID=A0AAV9H590_9PEZI|nr:hypothetical protein QBC34DRAFT_432930 [Podospora aff. communis PSN243]
MSQQKYLAIALVVGIGIFNGYYTFNQAFWEEKQKREGTYFSSTLQTQDTKNGPQPTSKDKSEGDKSKP